VLRVAADDESAVTGPGRADEARAFFHWLRRKDAIAMRPAVDAAAGRVSLPEKVSAAIGDFAAEAHDTPIAFLAELEEFSSAKEEEDEGKGAALRHARGARRHEKWCEFMAQYR
jgi:hypothetical protein